MSPLEELEALLSGGARAVVISSTDVDLRPAAGKARLFVLKVGEGSHAAGGRGGGFGERKVTGVYCVERSVSGWTRLYGEEDEAKASAFEVPYFVSRLPMVMADGTDTMGYGVVDPGLVAEMSAKSGISSPP